MTMANNEIETKLFGVESNTSVVDDDANAIHTSVKTTVIPNFIFDVTGSMHPVIEIAKNFAKSDATHFNEALGKKGREVEKTIVNVTAYRDVYVDGDKWIDQSPSFEISAGQDQCDAFYNYLDGLEAVGGGDEPESPLEALSYAIDHIDFSFDTKKARILFFFLSDASGHHLDDSRRYSLENYPENVPEEMEGIVAKLVDKIGADNMRSVRFFALTPNAYPWNEMKEYFPQFQLIPCRAGEGLDEIEKGIITTLVSDSI